MGWGSFRPGLRAVLLAAAVGLATGGQAAAQQIRLEPAFADLKPLGPEVAKGAVIWNHGRSVTSEDSLSPTPYYMSLLQDSGWAAYRLNRMRDGDTLQDSSRALVKEVQQLKQRGYKKVVLAGQSFGAFLALMAADATDEVDAVVATAPAAYGSFSEFYESFRRNATNFYPLLENVRHARVMLFFFHGDDFDPGGRGERSREILRARNLQHMVVDQPPFLTGHWAASTGLFVRRYGECIRNFIEAKALQGDEDCSGNWGQTPSKQIALPTNFQATPVKEAFATENAFIGKWYGFYGNGREVLLAVEKVRQDDVTAIYALGPGLQNDQKSEWVRRSGKLSDDEMIFREKGRNTLKYRLRDDGKLDATWISSDGKVSMDTVLRRID
jgi:pimeloyl-ACP methyl ester carboxylesterase